MFDALSLKSWERTLDLFHSGDQPRKIAEKQKMSLALVYDNLRFAVAKRRITRTEIWFSLNLHNENYAFLDKHMLSTRRFFQQLGSNWRDYEYSHFLDRVTGSPQFEGDKIAAQFELEFYCWTRSCHVEFYEIICEIEMILNWNIVKCLKRTYGEEWWLKGVPPEVRRDISGKYHYDSDRLLSVPEPFDDGETVLGSPKWRFVESDKEEDYFLYADFSDYIKIFEKQHKNVFSLLPKELGDKGRLKEDLMELSRIRNVFAHPIKILSYFYHVEQNVWVTIEENIYGEEEEIEGKPYVVLHRNNEAYKGFKFLMRFRSEIEERNWRYIDPSVLADLEEFLGPIRTPE